MLRVIEVGGGVEYDAEVVISKMTWSFSLIVQNLILWSAGILWCQRVNWSLRPVGLLHRFLGRSNTYIVCIRSTVQRIYSGIVR